MSEQLNLKKTDNSLSFKKPCIDFIPYACHFSENTILTKNHELLQVIKLVEFSGNFSPDDDDPDYNFLDIRKLIRKAIRLNSISSNVSYWITTIRCKKDMSLPFNYKEGSFSKEVNDFWEKQNNFENQYINEIYLTVIVGSGISLNLGLNKLKALLENLSFSKTRNTYLKEFKERETELDAVVKGILISLKAYMPKVLGIYKKEEFYYSEILTFFSKIVNLYENPVKLDTVDLSELLAKEAFVFGNNVVEIIGQDGRFFEKGLYLKEYQEKEIHVIDRILNMPQEFVVTETVDFLPKQEGIEYYKHQEYIFKSSKDKDLNDTLGLYNTENSKDMDYVNNQIHIFFKSDNFKELNSNIEEATAIFRSCGLVFVNMDLFFEDNFWGQLPANYLYLNKKKPFLTKHIAAFAYFNTIPLGSPKNNFWGDAVTTFRTIKGTPYYFNFHSQDNSGHVAIIGPKDSGKTTLMNFMISEAQKYNGKLFYFTCNKFANTFMDVLGGKNFFPEGENLLAGFRFSPLGLPDNKSSRLFLSKWLKILVFSDPLNLTEEDEMLVNKSLDYLYSLPPKERSLRSVIDLFGEEVSKSLEDFYKDGKYASFFDNIEENISFSEAIYGFLMYNFKENEKLMKLLLSYIFYKLEEQLPTDTPVIFAIDGKIYNFIDNSLFCFGLEAWLDKLKLKNIILIFTSEVSSKFSANSLFSKVLSNRIFMPGIKIDFLNKIFKFSDIEKDIYLSLSSGRREFLLKKRDDFIILCSQLKNFKNLDKLSCDDNLSEV